MPESKFGNLAQGQNFFRLSLSNARDLSTALLLLGLLLCLANYSAAQTPGVPVPATSHAVVNFTDLARRRAAAARPGPKQRLLRVAPFRTVSGGRPVPSKFVRPQKPAPPEANLALPSASLASPSPVASFEALRDQDVPVPPSSFANFIPPDTMGAAGPDHLMVPLNSQVRIQDRSGVQESIVSLEDFWFATGSSGAFDPKIIYDPYANRWIFAAMSDAETANSSILIGASQSSDPTGNWNLFRFDADGGDTDWADYPSLGFNKDWVVVSANMFPNAGGSFAGARLFLFRKSSLYDGTLNAATLFDAAFGFTLVPAVTYDDTLATLYLVDNGWSGGGHQFVRISTITGPVGSEVFTECDPNFPCPSGTTFVDSGSNWAFNPPGGADFAPQSGSVQKIQNGDARLLNLVYRNGSLWAAHNVFLPAAAPSRTAAQWWQFTPAGSLQQNGRVDDVTGTVFYAYPSIAANAQSDVLLGFSIFSASQYASAGYAFRFAADAANTLRDPVVLKVGEAPY